MFVRKTNALRILMGIPVEKWIDWKVEIRQIKN
jgi:hypothetical protein